MRRPEEIDVRVLADLDARGPLPMRRPAGVVANVALEHLASAFRGALIGGAIGDALGRPAEGRSGHVLEGRYGRLADYQPWAGWSGGPRGTVTDDTQMTMCVAECLVANDGRLDPADLAKRFVAWLPVGRGKGRACVAAVSALLEDVPWHEAGVDSAGNGAAMRAAPIGLAHIADLNALRRDAALSAIVTHANPMAVASAIAHGWLVARLATTPARTLDASDLVDDLCDAISDIDDPGTVERSWHARAGTTGSAIRLVDRLSEVPSWLVAEPEAASDWFYCGALVLESLPMALWHFLREPDNPEEAIVNAVMGGYDADTVASMTGAYAGAYHGEDAFPDRWVGDDLEFADELRGLADRLLELAGRRMRSGNE